MKWLIAWVVAAVSFGVLDALWLRWAGPNLYRPALGELLADKFRVVPAVLFYVVFITGMVWFAVRPGLINGGVIDLLDSFGLAKGVPYAVLNGALFGGIAYATYDLTNQATLKTWPVEITLLDIAWGASATALAAGAAAFAVLKLA